MPERSTHTTPHITAYVNYVKLHDKSVAQDCDSKMHNLNPPAGNSPSYYFLPACFPLFHRYRFLETNGFGQDAWPYSLYYTWKLNKFSVKKWSVICP